MATTDASLIAVHVFAGAEGESIVVRLPNGEWGVIDCYASSLKDESTNATLQFLVGQRVEQLAFLCLTHPHRDHYRGMSQLLDRFQVKCFWRPSVMTGQYLQWLLKEAKVDSKQSGDHNSIDDANELEAIFRKVKEQRKVNLEPLISKNASTGTKLFPIPLRTDSSSLEVWAIAPAGRQQHAYEESLSKCFDESQQLVRPDRQTQHNAISLALLIVYGETRLVLGGDVESGGWQDVLQEFSNDNLACHAVKVSHHGSCNGYTADLWPCFARVGRPIAVVTPYLKHRLPDPVAIAHIRNYTSMIATPCIAAAQRETPELPLSTSAPVRSRSALHDKFKATKQRRYQTGRCSLTFDNAGNCVEQDFDEHAGLL